MFFSCPFSLPLGPLGLPLTHYEYFHYWLGNRWKPLGAGTEMLWCGAHGRRLFCSGNGSLGGGWTGKFFDGLCSLFWTEVGRTFGGGRGSPFGDGMGTRWASAVENLDPLGSGDGGLARNSVGMLDGLGTSCSRWILPLTVGISGRLWESCSHVRPCCVVCGKYGYRYVVPPHGIGLPRGSGRTFCRHLVERRWLPLPEWLYAPLYSSAHWSGSWVLLGYALVEGVFS